MSEIKKRRVAGKHDNRTCATYEVDAALFAKEGGLIWLPNPKGKDRFVDPDWNDVALTDNVWPWLPTSLHNTIRELGYFPFIYTEEYGDEEYVRRNVVICKDGCARILRFEDKEGNVIPTRESSPYAIISFYEDYYTVRDFGMKQLADENGKDFFHYEKNATLDGIDSKKTAFTGFDMLEDILKTWRPA